ncbi:MAG: flippase, partial [bacterium]
AIMYFIFLVNDFGLNTLTTRENARDHNEAGKVFGSALLIKLMLITASALVLLLALWIYELPRQAVIATAIFAVYGVLSSLGQLAYGVFRSFERMEYETITVILEKTVITGLGILFLVQGADLLEFSLVFAIGGLITLFISFYLINKHFFKIRLQIDPKHAWTILKASAIFGLSMFLITAYLRIPILLLGSMKSDEVIAWYSAAYRLTTLTSVIPTIIVSATFPKLSRESQVRQEVVALLFTKGFKYLFFLALPLIAGTYVLAEPIINLVYGSDFSEAIPVLKLLSFAAALSFMNIFIAGLFGATNNQKKMFVLQTFVLAINIILNLLLIPKAGHIGAAWASVATEGVMFGSALYIALAKITHLKESRFIFKAACATVIMTVFLLFSSGFHLFVGIIVAILLYFISLFLLRGFTFEEIWIFREQANETEIVKA